MPITRSTGGALCNPFPMGARGTDERYRQAVCAAHAEWLRLGDVKASAVVAEGGRAPRILQADGTAFPMDIAPTNTGGWEQ